MVVSHLLHVLGMDPARLSGAEALERLRATLPAAYTIADQWQTLRDEVETAGNKRQKENIVARQLRRSYNLSNDVSLEEIYWRLRKQIKIARKALIQLYTEYLPEELASHVTPKLPLDDPDPVRLIELGLPASHGQLALAFTREQFEARQALLLGLVFFDITMMRWGGRLADPGQLTRFLVEEHILAKQPKKFLLVSFHDPANEFRCVGIEGFCEPTAPKERLLRRTTPVKLACVNDGTPVPIIYSVRKKEPMSILRRVLVDKEWDPGRVRDRWAFRFCYFSEADLLQTYSRVSQRLLTGSTGELRDRFTPTSQNPNPHSAPDFRGIKHQGRIRGGVYEIDHMLAETWLNIEYSHGTINHDRYHARQMLETDPPGLFLCTAPSGAYSTPDINVNWGAEETREKIRQHIIASLYRK